MPTKTIAWWASRSGAPSVTTSSLSTRFPSTTATLATPSCSCRCLPRPASARYACRWAASPASVAHGFLALEDDTEVLYQMSEYYEAAAAGGIRYDDPAFEIRWPADVVISARDRSYLTGLHRAVVTVRDAARVIDPATSGTPAYLPQHRRRRHPCDPRGHRRPHRPPGSTDTEEH
jgi:dTDP-4-dehydrorhamnose 3,5-epimerase